MALVELVRLPNGAEAELLRGRLESAGVHAVCFDAGMNIAISAQAVEVSKSSAVRRVVFIFVYMPRLV